MKVPDTLMMSVNGAVKVVEELGLPGLRGIFDDLIDIINTQDAVLGIVKSTLLYLNDGAEGTTDRIKRALAVMEKNQ